jgi:hypothetical protein
MQKLVMIKAMNQINIAINLLEKNKDYYAISDYLTYMSDIYIKTE